MIKSNDNNFTNLIIVARFADENEFINNMYNGEAVKNMFDAGVQASFCIRVDIMRSTVI